MPSFQKLSERAWHALAEALCAYEWFKPEFQTLVRSRFADEPDALAAVNFDETKRIATGQLIAALRANEQKYQTVAIDALLALGEVDIDFPHLARITDGPKRVSEARAAHKAVRYVIDHSELAASRRSARLEAEKRAVKESVRRLHESKLSQLREEFFTMHQSSDAPQKRGRDFERFLNELFALSDLNPRAAYSIEHEQVDGAFTLRDDYLLEARWVANPLQPKDLNDFRAKINDKARNTLGLFVSVLGFTEGAIAKHSGGQTPLILMDGTDLVPILEGRIGLIEVLEQKRRHAAETGQPMHRA